MNKRFWSFALTYAFRSLGRNRRRTILTIATVGLSVMVSLVAQRYTQAIMTIWREGAADTGDGHAQVHKQGYWQKQEGVTEDLTLSNNNQVEQKLKEIDYVEASARRLRFEGIISTGTKSVYFIGLGVDPDNEILVSPRLFNPQNDKGQFVQGNDRVGITIGKGLAETLDLKLGDEATLIAQTVQGSANGIDVVVKGIVYVPLPSFSKRAVYTHIDQAQQLIRLPEKYTEIAIRLKNVNKTQDLINRMQGAVKAAEAEIRGWWDIQPLIPKVEIIWNTIIGIVSILLFVSATLGVLNIIYMLVAERTVEIGTLMAIGAKSGEIKALFTVEACLIGIFGGTAGIIVGNILVLIMNFKGINFDNPFGSGSVLVFPTVSILTSLAVFLIAVFICSIAAIFPAHKASKIEPVRAFRGQLN